MKLEIDIPEHHYNNIMSIDSVCIGRAPYKGIIMYAINAIKHGKVLEQEPTTKNDLEVVDCISRAEAIKCLECDFDITGEENMKTVVNYINSAHDKIVNLPRVKQELTSKNDLGVASELEKNSKKLEKDFGELDCISRADAIRVASGYCHPSNVAKELAKLPSVTPQEPFMATPCISSKVCEHDRMVTLDKIRAEIEEQKKERCFDDDDMFAYRTGLDDALYIIDKYKAERSKNDNT